jgi:hypothetical protein
VNPAAARAASAALGDKRSAAAALLWNTCSTPFVPHKVKHGLISRQAMPSNSAIWLTLVAALVLVKISLMAFFPQALADPDQARLFSWPALAIFSAIGFLAVLLAGRTGFPAAWDARIPARRRLLLPLAGGAALGVAMVALDHFTGLSLLIAANHGLAQQYTGLVPMLLSFAVAAPIIVEVLYRLLIIPLLLWLVSSVILRGRGQERTFWVLAAVLSALEPFTQTPDLRVLPPVVMLMDATLMYGVNLTQAAFFRKCGFLASILVRAGFYLVWHVLYVH